MIRRDGNGDRGRLRKRLGVASLRRVGPGQDGVRGRARGRRHPRCARRARSSPMVTVGCPRSHRCVGASLRRVPPRRRGRRGRPGLAVPLEGARTNTRQPRCGQVPPCHLPWDDARGGERTWPTPNSSRRGGERRGVTRSSDSSSRAGLRPTPSTSSWPTSEPSGVGRPAPARDHPAAHPGGPVRAGRGGTEFFTTGSDGKVARWSDRSDPFRPGHQPDCVPGERQVHAARLPGPAGPRRGAIGHPLSRRMDRGRSRSEDFGSNRKKGEGDA